MLCHREVAELKEELAMYDVMAGRSPDTSYAPYTESQRAHVRCLVNQFLESPELTPTSLAPLQLNSMRQMRETLYACKVRDTCITGCLLIWPKAKC